MWDLYNIAIYLPFSYNNIYNIRNLNKIYHNTRYIVIFLIIINWKKKSDYINFYRKTKFKNLYHKENHTITNASRRNNYKEFESEKQSK